MLQREKKNEKYDTSPKQIRYENQLPIMPGSEPDLQVHVQNFGRCPLKICGPKTA